ncbi:MAG TPA: ATP-dependent DNA ligase, partial [Pseudorhizobium sp.]|nr:ATP-dependent DNA ligase [Pseudorhizobium sp.]
MDFGLPIDLEPMEARSAEQLPDDDGWQYEPKWDGFRCLAFKHGSRIDLRAKSGKPLGRYFPEVIDHLASLDTDQFVLDGELVIEREGRLSFDALQMRLHPAESRIRRLAGETPAKLILFDMLLSNEGEVLLGKPLSERRQMLERFVSSSAKERQLTLSPVTGDVDVARRWLAGAGNGDIDGVVCKRLDAPYLSGERAMVKVKRLRTADCVVGGFRYQSSSDLVGSLLLGLYNDQGELDHVGYTSTIANKERPELTTRLEALRHSPGFTGKTPGGP